MKAAFVKPDFVKAIPERLDEGVLYISLDHRIAIHLCCCGCRQEVVTPLSPADWQLRRVGNAVTLHPSIGNWSFTCRSHYWIRGNRVEWAGSLSDAQVRKVRERDRQDKARYIDEINLSKESQQGLSSKSWWRQLWERAIKWIFGK